MSLRPAVRRRTSESGSWTESGRNSIPLTAETIAVFAPMPTASESTTTAVHPLACINTRKPWRRSLSMTRPLSSAVPIRGSRGVRAPRGLRGEFLRCLRNPRSLRSVLVRLWDEQTHHRTGYSSASPAEITAIVLRVAPMTALRGIPPSNVTRYPPIFFARPSR